MHLSTLEAEILGHRLEMPDAIAEAMTETLDGEPCLPWSFDDVHAAAVELLEGLPQLPDAPSALQRLILHDTASGSVFWQVAIAAVEDGDMSRGKLRSIAKAITKLEGKLTSLLGCRVEIERE